MMMKRSIAVCRAALLCFATVVSMDGRRAARAAAESPKEAKSAEKAAGGTGGVKPFLFKSYPSVESLLQALPAQVEQPAALKGHLQALLAGYPDLIAGLQISADGQLFLELADHSTHLYDDGRRKSAEQRLEEPDLEDMFHDAYPLTNPTGTLPVDFDPGRVRSEPFFKAIYGGSPA